jgi:erythromycin esterase-like protein
MTTTTSPATSAALPEQTAATLDPVRSALRRRAAADAAAVLAAADAEARAVLAAARREAADIRAAARAEGERDAAAVEAAERARARARARAVVLAARRRAYDRLRDRSRAAVRALRADPVYPRLRERLRERVAARLGPGAEIGEHPDGGVLARDGARRVDLGLDVLADLAVDGLGAEVEQLWAP